MAPEAAAVWRAEAGGTGRLDRRNVRRTPESTGSNWLRPLPMREADRLARGPQPGSLRLAGHALGLCHVLSGLLKGFCPQHYLLRL